MATLAELLIDNRANHAEGPVWDDYRRRLFWVDLTAGTLFSLDPSTRQVQWKTFSESICAVAPCGPGPLLVAFAKRLTWVEWPSGKIREIAPVEPTLPNNRCNDGKFDPAGRFWIGTMSEGGEIAGAGALYRLETDGTLTTVLRDLTIANGLGWAPDGRTMYFIDSPTREVWAFDFVSKTSAISRRRIVVRVPPGLGLPDGMTVDRDGLLWVAHWGAGCVCQWDPRSGALLQTVHTGCPHTTSCAFAGDDRTIFITTSRLGLSQAELSKAPHSGGLFRLTLTE